MSADCFTFQQDSAPAHQARETVVLLTRETPDFIPPTLWPPNSLDLNTVDYKIWSVLQDRVYRSRIRDVNHLRERLLEEWNRFDQHHRQGCQTVASASESMCACRWWTFWASVAVARYFNKYHSTVLFRTNHIIFIVRESLLYKHKTRHVKNLQLGNLCFDPTCLKIGIVLGSMDRNR